MSDGLFQTCPSDHVIRSHPESLLIDIGCDAFGQLSLLGFVYLQLINCLLLKIFVFQVMKLVNYFINLTFFN